MTPEEYERKIAELEARLRDAEHDRDTYFRQMKSLLPTMPEEEEREFLRQVEAGEYAEDASRVWAIIEELERDGK